MSTTLVIPAKTWAASLSVPAKTQQNALVTDFTALPTSEPDFSQADFSGTDFKTT